MDILRHLYNFSPRTLSKILGKTGFEVKKIAYSPRFDIFQWSLDFFLEEKGYRMRIGFKCRANPLVKLTAKLLSLCYVSSIMTFYANKSILEGE